MNPADALAQYLEVGGKWKGHQQYVCKLCSFNCLRVERAMKHVSNVHFKGKSPGQATTVQTSIVDGSGRPLTMEVKENGRINDS